MSDATVSGGGDASNDPVSPVAGGRRLLTGREKVMIGVAVFAACGMVALWPSGKATPEREQEQPMTAAGRSLPYRPMPEPAPIPSAPVAALPAVPTPAMMPMPMPAPGSAVAFGGGRQLPNPTPIMSDENRAASQAAQPVQNGAPGMVAAQPRVAPVGASPAGLLTGAAEPDDRLSSRLRPSRMAAARATVLQNPELTVPVGTRIPCIPEMPIDSSVAGFFSCITPVDVRGSTGTVVLMERGTRIVGEVRSGLVRGARRLFVVMTQALTPGGVQMELNSPGADVMGQAGLDGEIDSHFFERFRGAMLLAFLDTGLQAAATVASNALNNGNGVTFNQFQSGGQRATSQALDADINIPATLRRNQAEPMTVFVARNLDFSDVYRLVSR
ncbi:MAG TPA: TrbI/VirB10 family protein [Roseomonas sp.]|nr:TrbI/VirB10 family protein [Roseomonas sp.]